MEKGRARIARWGFEVAGVEPADCTRQLVEKAVQVGKRPGSSAHERQTARSNHRRTYSLVSTPAAGGPDACERRAAAAGWHVPAEPTMSRLNSQVLGF